MGDSVTNTIILDQWDARCCFLRVSWVDPQYLLLCVLPPLLEEGSVGRAVGDVYLEAERTWVRDGGTARVRAMLSSAGNQCMEPGSMLIKRVSF